MYVELWVYCFPCDMMLIISSQYEIKGMSVGWTLANVSLSMCAKHLVFDEPYRIESGSRIDHNLE